MEHPRGYPHISITKPPVVEPFAGYGIGNKRRKLDVDHQAQGRVLLASVNAISRQYQEAQAQSIATPIPTAAPGVYLEVVSREGEQLNLEQLAPASSNLDIRALHEMGTVSQSDAPPSERAILFASKGDVSFLRERLEVYRRPRSGKKREVTHRHMLDPVMANQLANLESLWTESEVLPPLNEVVWWELWLRRSDEFELLRLRHFARQQRFYVSEQSLAFDEQIVTMVRASAVQLAPITAELQDLAEVRKPSPTVRLFRALPHTEQRAWGSDLLSRVQVAPPGSAAVSLLDTGINSDHPLLRSSIAPAECHAYDLNWGSHDHHGHGTEMAGLALYGDMAPLLETTEKIYLTHRLESVKILPPSGDNERNLYGAITAEAISRLEVDDPARRRVVTLAITSGPDSGKQGRPTQWSAAVDAVAAGRSFDLTKRGLIYLDTATLAGVSRPRLILVSSGNVRNQDIGMTGYLDRCDLSGVHEPAQSWNALTIGAYTEKTLLNEEDEATCTPLAPAGDLAPMSTTSIGSDRRWPNKPDVVFEGGNFAVTEAGDIDAHYDMLLLTTSHSIDYRLFDVTNGTSAATALAARMAARIWQEYPHLTAESVRGLIVHSARWTPEMEQHLPKRSIKGDRDKLLRRYGWGVPQLDLALRSASNEVTLIYQGHIRPYSIAKRQQVHFHRLPWPIEILEGLGDSRVRLRATLSYFVDPNPGPTGQRDPRVYRSHGLRYDLKRPTESLDVFMKRINRNQKGQSERRPSGSGDESDWFFGQEIRFTGSIHSDYWDGTAADLAGRDSVAIYPVAGWWRTSRNPAYVRRRASYSLVLSIEAEEADLDLWTPVSVLARQDVALPVEVGIG